MTGVQTCALPISNNVTIQIDGTTWFLGSVTPTGTDIEQSPDPTGPFTTIEFDYDAQVQIGTDTSNTVTKPFSLAVVGGKIIIETIQCNYAVSWIPGPPSVPIAGTATDWKPCQLASQPLWNGQADTTRYDWPNTDDSAGEILVEPNETVTFDLNIYKYNDVSPLPTS